jgi:hypothetical protein
MYIAQRPASINVCGEIDRATAAAGGLLLLIWAICSHWKLLQADYVAADLYSAYLSSPGRLAWFGFTIQDKLLAAADGVFE